MVSGISSRKSLPEVSSTLLKMHQLYLRQPPHDTSLYDTLEVSPNATSAEIATSYRKICRRLHPDKNPDHDYTDQLSRVRTAFEILKHDNTRLSYHRHGLLNAMDAVYILTGSIHRKAVQKDDEEQRSIQMELLELMGFPFHDKEESSPWFSTFSDDRPKRDRVLHIATTLFERLRPILEGTLPEHLFLDHFMQQCDRWKSLPLGAQILRCIGRAYRYSGERFLRKGLPLAGVQDNVLGVARIAKYFANAAVAGGRVVLEERKRKKKKSPKYVTPKQIHWEDMDEGEFALSGESIREQELDKAHQAVLESLQVEALWKVCKIDLDRTIRTACELLLEGQSPMNAGDGWVGERGETIMADNGRLQLASLLVRMGNIMVHRSKQGTAWME